MLFELRKRRTIGRTIVVDARENPAVRSDGRTDDSSITWEWDLYRH